MSKKMPVHASRRRGSALLIVLGFLSFMVVSAVAFAVFMRAERSPSSAYRRSVATRHLVKAALARAISAVDDAVRGDAFPGIPGGNTAGVVYRDLRNNEMNVWQGRVFMPPDSAGSTQPGVPESRFAPISQTVSVLCLEALGYLPPPLVNDVRFLSRCSWSSRWQNLPYDAGRYAYVAVNVSDYLDLNRLSADSGRTSGGSDCISLAGVFTKRDGRSIDTAAAEQFEDLVRERRQAGNDNVGNATATMPYISMLDYNLALGSWKGSAGMGDGYNSPFYDWVDTKSSSQRRAFYGTLATKAESGSGAFFASRQTFVTDSWFPMPRPGGSATVDPEGDEGNKTNLVAEIAQPFKQSLLERGSSCMAVLPMGNNSEFKQRVQVGRQLLTQADWASLYDYLDRDDIPLSLVLPSVERIPMVAAITPNLNGVNLSCNVETKSAKSNVKEDGSYTKVTTTTARFKPALFPQSVALNTVFAFPFKHAGDLGDDRKYRAQAMLRLFLVATPVSGELGTGQASAIKLRSSSLAALRPRKEEWTGGAKAFQLQRGGASAALTYVGTQNIGGSLPQDVVEERDAVFNVNFNLSMAPAGEEPVFFTRVETVEMKANDQPAGDPKIQWEFPTPPLLADGTAAPAADGDAWAEMKLTPCAAVWVKVENTQDDGTCVVDYAPAVINDDKELGGNDNSTLAQIGSSVANYGPDTDNGTEGVPAPLLPMVGEASLPLSTILTAGSTSPGAAIDVPPVAVAAFSPRAYCVVDPRYNWAPEDWLPRNGAMSDNAWLSFVQGILDGDTLRDPDIFMGYSNQGYLQSMGELAMLPCLTENGSPLVASWNSNQRDPDCDWKQIAHQAFAWRTYPMDCELDEDPADRKRHFWEKGDNYSIISEGRGFRVNPWTDNVRVMATAFSCTPCSWWAAGTTNAWWNKSWESGDGCSSSMGLKKKIVGPGTAKEALKFAFCEENQNPGDRLSQQDVEQIARQFVAGFRARPNMTWQQAYDAIWREGGLGDDPDRIFGISLKNNVKLHNVDRKFLYAYWRGCFANKQQLFLIFVRAESNALGGPGEGTPAQKGGRAVALVWRDPNVPPRNGGASDPLTQDRQNQYVDNRHPHRTRVLFYHQFD